MRHTRQGFLYDAHCHYQDPRLRGFMEDRGDRLKELGIRSAVVNGTSPDDWDAVESMAARYQPVIASLGLHPWYVDPSDSHWFGNLEERVRKRPRPIGEIGLDRWKQGYDIEAQTTAFNAQLRLARKHGLPVSIHCLRAWGLLYELLEKEGPPEAGFLLHSYGGPAEMVPGFVRLGARFSFSAYFARPGKERKLQAFRSVPVERLLIETDAPDMLGPERLCRESLTDECGEPINSPANLLGVYGYAANLYGIDMEEFKFLMEDNFMRLFGRWVT